jgi:hypothetical protein
METMRKPTWFPQQINYKGYFKKMEKSTKIKGHLRDVKPPQGPPLYES